MEMAKAITINPKQQPHSSMFLGLSFSVCSDDFSRQNHHYKLQTTAPFIHAFRFVFFGL